MRFGGRPDARVSASAYYHRAPSRQLCSTHRDGRLLETIEQVHARNCGAYGYRKTWLALQRADVEVGRDRVKRLMRAHPARLKMSRRPWDPPIQVHAFQRVLELTSTSILPTVLCKEYLSSTSSAARHWQLRQRRPESSASDAAPDVAERRIL